GGPEKSKTFLGDFKVAGAVVGIRRCSVAVCLRVCHKMWPKVKKPFRKIDGKVNFGNYLPPNCRQTMNLRQTLIKGKSGETQHLFFSDFALPAKQRAGPAGTGTPFQVPL